MNKPVVWKMVKEAVEAAGGESTNAQIKQYILSKYGDVNETTINCTILACCVNKQSRTNWPENHKPRLASSQYDFLFSTGRAQVELYQPEKHGLWEIRNDAAGKLVVCQVVSDSSLAEQPLPERSASPEEPTENEKLLFPLESHLRDFVGKNLDSISVQGQKLRLYVDDAGANGIEYQTDVGRVDILAVDENDNFVVIELKLSRGADHALGQLLRYMGWIKANMSPHKPVKGVIVAGNIDDKLRYAASVIPEVALFRYDLVFSLYEELL